MNPQKSHHPRSRLRTRSVALLIPLVLATAPVAAGTPALAAAAVVGHGQRVEVAPGQTWTVTRTTTLRSLTLAEGAAIAAPEGYTIVLTVDGVETGGVIESTGGTDTVIRPGTYAGHVVVHVLKANEITWQSLVFPLRQALYVGADGVDASMSAASAIVKHQGNGQHAGGRVTDSATEGVRIASTGENFTGFYVKNRAYKIRDSRIEFTGNGRSDFIGYGAGVVGTGADTRLVLDDVTIRNKGAARGAVLADDGANVIVKNSDIRTSNGTLPDDYVSTVDLAKMQQAPWMLGIVGNNRSTNLMGADTRATYISSSIASEGWGVLSTDSGSDGQLTSINSDVANTGDEGYGAYAIGGATDRFLGTHMDVGTYAAIVTGGTVTFGDSTKAAVSALNDSLELGLTAQEFKKLAVRCTIVDSRGWGVMWHGQGTAVVDGRTVLRSARSTFLDKGQEVDITVDGSQGATLDPGNGVLMQVMDNDDPGPVMVDGKLVNAGVYTEPTTAPTKVDGFDVTAVHDADAAATFTDTALTGDFYNGIRGGGTGGSGPGSTPQGKNLVLTFDDSTVDGVISASTTDHAVDTITAAEYDQLGKVTNTVGPVVNNGVIVELAGDSAWTVNGTSYLSSLTVGPDASVLAPAGKTLSMSVDGVITPLEAGHSYTGNLVLTLS